VIVPAPITQADAEKRVQSNGSGVNVTDWYFTKKRLSAASAKAS